MKDWKGNKASVHHLLGVDYKTKCESVNREKRDFYATDPMAVRLLMQHWQLPTNTFIWEPACGTGCLSTELSRLGYCVYSTDIVFRGYDRQNETFDFLKYKYCKQGWHQTDNCCILTNPPYRYANEFILHALELLPDGGWCAMLLNINQLSGKTRYEKIYRQHPPKTVYIFTGRIQCAKNGDFTTDKANGAINYGWFVWQKGYTGPTSIEWIQTDKQ